MNFYTAFEKGLRIVEEKMLLRISVSHKHTAGSRFMQGPWSLLLPPGADYWNNIIIIFISPRWGIHPEAFIAFGKAKACGFRFLL